MFYLKVQAEKVIYWLWN